MTAINDRALNIIKESESFSDHAYYCPAGKLTIGYGHTGPGVRKTDRITKEAAEALLKSDIERFSTGVKNSIGLAKTTENQFGAMVSLAFNIGLGEFRRSSLLGYHKNGNYEEAANQFGLFVHGGGKVLPGLVTRRKREAELYADHDA